MARGEATPFFDSVAAVSSGSLRMELWEIALAPTPPVAPPKFVTFTHFTPGVGLAGELRRVLVENARDEQAAGVGRSVIASMSGPTRLDVVRLYADLAELEAARVPPPTAAEALRRIMRVTPLLGAVVATSIVEVVVPFPAR